METMHGISFDVEDWFQVENLKGAISADSWDRCDLRVVENTRRILRILARYDTKATFFILGWIAERCAALVEEIAAAGHEIASHGYGHELITRQDEVKFALDLKRSKKIIEAITCRPVQGYRAPSFSLTPETDWALNILRDQGFSYDSSVFPTSFHDRYGFKGASRFPFRYDNGLVELPLSTVKIWHCNFPAAGGGYFRLFPYFLFCRLCRCIVGEGKRLVFYLHPWELDPDQPRIPIRRDYRFRHYVNLERTAGRLEMFLQDFRFGPLGCLAESLLQEAP